METFLVEYKHTPSVQDTPLLSETHPSFDNTHPPTDIWWCESVIRAFLVVVYYKIFIFKSQCLLTGWKEYIVITFDQLGLVSK